jgi:hypothetical protein
VIAERMGVARKCNRFWRGHAAPRFQVDDGQTIR